MLFMVVKTKKPAESAGFYYFFLMFSDYFVVSAVAGAEVCVAGAADGKLGT